MQLDLVDDIDFCEPIRLGTIEMIYEGTDGIIFHELRSHALMVSMNNCSKFKEIFEKEELSSFELFDVKQKEIADMISQYSQKTTQFACYQAVYNKKQPLVIKYPKDVSICLLSLDYAQQVIDGYQHQDDPQYIKDLIEKGHLWGLFENNQLAGFIGIHAEGSMGLLEVLPQYQRKGYGTILESYLINYLLKHDCIPYCQVIEGNNASLSLQKKLKLELSSKVSYWLF